MNSEPQQRENIFKKNQLELNTINKMKNTEGINSMLEEVEGISNLEDSCNST